MSSINPRININSASTPYTKLYDHSFHVDQNRSKNYLNRPNDVDRENYLYPDRYRNSPKQRGYKYTFYKDPPPNQFYYHSKQSISLDSFKDKQKSFQQNNNYLNHQKQHSPSRSPSFKPNELKSRQFLDSIDNIIQSHRSKYTHSSNQPYNHFQLQPDQILLLKQKLLQTHHKFLKQLEQSNRLGFQLQNAQAQCQAQQKLNKKIQFQLDKLVLQNQKLHSQLQQKATKREQKFKSLENKAHEESKRNNQLKDDLETMRNKMLQTLRLKNNFQEQNASYKSQMNILGKNIQKLRVQIKEKDQTIEYLNRQLDVLKKKFQRCQKECEERAQQIHQYSHLASQRQKILNTLQNELKMEKDKSSNTLCQIKNIQAEHKTVLKKLNDVEDLCQKYKGQIYWLQKNKENNDKILIQKMQKLTEQNHQLSIRLKQKERQMQSLRKKPVFDAQKKKKNYEHTKQFVSKLQSEQNQISMSRTRGYSKNSGRGSSGSKTPQYKKTFNNSKSPNKSTMQNILNHEPITHKQNQSSYHEQKSKYISMLDQIGGLEEELLKYNNNKNKMLVEIDRIDEKKVKTKQMISRRRTLQEDIKYQQSKIRQLKQQLRKVKAL